MSYKDNPKGYTRCEKCKHIDRENEKCKITNDNWLVSDRAGTCHQFEGVESMKVKPIYNIRRAYKLEASCDKEYEVVREEGKRFVIINDQKEEKAYYKSWFEVVEDKNKKLEENPHKKSIKGFEENIKKGAEMLAKCSMSSIDVKKSSNVNHPSHYNKGKFEVIDVIEDWNFGFNLGNAIKYIARCEYKDNKKQDLEKAMWYLKREIERVKANV